MSAADGSVPTLAIVTALPEEFRPIRSKQAGRRAETISGRRVSTGRIGAWPCVLLMGGEGLANARKSARLLLEHSRPVALLGAGVAGAISPALRAGDILAGARIVGPGTSRFSADPVWLERSLRAGASEGLLVSGERLLATSEAKSSLWRSIDSIENAAVDLESSAWAQEAGRAGVPFLALRSIADCADEELPALLASSRDSSGATDRAKVAIGALRHPRAIAGLARLFRRTSFASARLAETLERLLSEFAP